MTFRQRPPASLASVLGVRQDASVGVDTANGLLLTILGEFVLPHEGRAWTQTVLALLELLGVRDKSARQSVARMHQRGLLHRDKVGRQVQVVLTERARELLAPGARRIYDFGQHPGHWDGSWIVLLASVPERERNLRYRLTAGLNWAGFGSLGQGVWVSPWLGQEWAAVRLLETLGIVATTFRAQLGELGSPPSVAADAWDLVALRELYDSFIADTAGLARRRPTGGQAAAELTLLVHRWRRFPFLDPDLPTELLPRDWPGPRAAQRFASVREALRPQADLWWSEVDADLGPTS